MKKRLVLAAMAMFIFAVAASAQTSDYSGTWELDKTASKLDDRSKSIESMTVTITQTDKDITVRSETKRGAPPEGAGMGGNGGGRPAGMGGGMGRMGGGMMGGDSSTTYTLDGKETKTEQQGPNGAMPVSLKARSDGGKLKLSRESSFSGPMGEVTISTKDTLSLSADGKVLTIQREQSTPRGTQSNTFVLNKK